MRKFTDPNEFGWTAALVKVIRTELTVRGKGVEEDPIRRITQYWSLEGILLAEVDPCPKDGLA